MAMIRALLYILSVFHVRNPRSYISAALVNDQLHESFQTSVNLLSICKYYWGCHTVHRERSTAAADDAPERHIWGLALAKAVTCEQMNVISARR